MEIANILCQIEPLLRIIVLLGPTLFLRLFVFTVFILVVCQGSKIGFQNHYHDNILGPLRTFD